MPDDINLMPGNFEKEKGSKGEKRRNEPSPVLVGPKKEKRGMFAKIFSWFKR